jgi:hypothetical protein
MGDSMQALKIVVVVMAVLIVLGTAGVVTVIVRRSAATAPVVAPAPPISLALEEPEGTRIAGIAALHDRLAVQLQGGGVDRIVLVDPLTGAVAGRIALAR